MLRRGRKITPNTGGLQAEPAPYYCSTMAFTGPWSAPSHLCLTTPTFTAFVYLTGAISHGLNLPFIRSKFPQSRTFLPWGRHLLLLALPGPSLPPVPSCLHEPLQVLFHQPLSTSSLSTCPSLSSLKKRNKMKKRKKKNKTP